MHDINPAVRPEQSPEFAHAWFAHRSLTLKLHSLGLYQHILRSLTPARGGVIADFGCGAGELTSELPSALAPSELTAIDVNPYLLQRCRDICGDRVTTHCQDIASPSLLRSHSVDGLVCSNVVMHLSDDECARLFKEISRVLSPSGPRSLFLLTHSGRNSIMGNSQKTLALSTSCATGVALSFYKDTAQSATIELWRTKLGSQLPTRASSESQKMQSYQTDTESIPAIPFSSSQRFESAMKRAE